MRQSVLKEASETKIELHFRIAKSKEHILGRQNWKMLIRISAQLAKNRFRTHANKCSNSTLSLAGMQFFTRTVRQIYPTSASAEIICSGCTMGFFRPEQTVVSPPDILTETGEHFYWHVSRTQVGLFSLANQGARNKTKRSARRQTRSRDTCFRSSFA